MKSIVLLSICFLTAVAANAQELWRDTSYGMSVDNVRQLVPDAKSPTTPSTLKGGGECLLALDKVIVNGDPFNACFFFLQGKLHQVTLSHTSPGRFGLASVDFDGLLDVLRAKYGKELDLKTSGDDILRQRKATWLSGRTNITLFLIGIADSEAKLSINYQARLAEEADKL